MSTLSLAVRDSSTMVRRNLLHARRYPSMTLNLLLTPVMLLLIFVYVFGDVMSSGLGGHPDRARYIAYVVPGILMMTIGGASLGVAVSVCTDMTEGVIARFRTMAIYRGSVLVGHVVGGVLQVLISVVLVIGVGFAIGFRTDASPLEWLAAIGLTLLVGLALTWLAVGIGLSSPNPEGASNVGLPLMILPLLGSAFVPVDSMPGWFRWFADYQPFTPFIESLRGLLLGTPIGHNGWLAAGWGVALTALGAWWSTRLFHRDPSHAR